MNIYQYISIIIVIAALISYINHRFFRWHTSIAVMASALLLSILLLFISSLGFPVLHEDIIKFVQFIHFRNLVMDFLLGILLFSGSLSVHMTSLREQKYEVGILTTLSTIASAFIIAFIMYLLLPLLGINLAFIYCMLFGSLISPTDPVAVLAVFKKLGATKKLETMVSAESLFNDGVGVVLFITTYKVAFLDSPATPVNVIGLFLREAAGGLFFGIILGWVIYQLIYPIKDSRLEILMTVGFVIGGYSLAQSLGISGPLAMVSAGMFLANYRLKEKDNMRKRKELNNFWELMEELSNIVLFLLLGFEVLLINFSWKNVAAAVIAIPVALLVRYITVAIPIAILKPWRKHTPYTISILTWGGLRGGLAVALALGIPQGFGIRTYILTFTYAIVVFSILIQGTTVKYFINLANRISEKRSQKSSG